MKDDLLSNVLRVERESETLRTRTVDTLRRAILNLHFKPGQRLIERELCEQTGVSRTSIREALRHLEAEGLIETIPNKGPMVATVTKEEARQIYEVRAPLEALICELFTERASEAEIHALEASVDNLEAAINDRNIEGAQQAKEAFFDILYDGCSNYVACSVSRSLRARVNFLSAEGTKRWDQETVRRRRKVVEAVRRRDGKSAKSAFLRHMSVAREISGDLLDQLAVI